MTDRELMQQVLEALEWWEAEFGGNEAPEPAITALRERLAQPERKPLTDEEIETCRQQGYDHSGLSASFDFVKTARAIEAAHGIKENT